MKRRKILVSSHKNNYKCSKIAFCQKGSDLRKVSLALENTHHLSLEIRTQSDLVTVHEICH